MVKGGSWRWWRYKSHFLAQILPKSYFPAYVCPNPSPVPFPVTQILVTQISFSQRKSKVMPEFLFDVSRPLIKLSKLDESWAWFILNKQTNKIFILEQTGLKSIAIMLTYLWFTFYWKKLCNVQCPAVQVLLSDCTIMCMGYGRPKHSLPLAELFVWLTSNTNSTSKKFVSLQDHLSHVC